MKRSLFLHASVSLVKVPSRLTSVGKSNRNHTYGFQRAPNYLFLGRNAFKQHAASKDSAILSSCHIVPFGEQGDILWRRIRCSNIRFASLLTKWWPFVFQQPATFLGTTFLAIPCQCIAFLPSHSVLNHTFFRVVSIGLKCQGKKTKVKTCHQNPVKVGGKNV